MKQKQSIKNRLVFSVFGSVFVFAAFLLIYYENELHQLSINKSSQIVDLVGSRYHQNISNFLRGCHQHFENIKLKKNYYYLLWELKLTLVIILEKWIYCPR